MSLVIIFFCIALLVVLISLCKVNAFLSFLIISILAGLLLKMPPAMVAGAVQKGIGDMLGGLLIIIVAGAMLGKLVAESGAAQQIASSMVRLFGEKNVQWALMATGFMIGIPLFYNVGFMLVVPLIFSVAYRYKLPAVYIGLPMIASLSVTHGFLPPHPSPTALAEQFNADISTTLLYGVVIAIPTLILAGPVFTRTLRDINPPFSKMAHAAPLPESQLPGLFISIFTSLLPVILLGVTSLVAAIEPSAAKVPVVAFITDPSIVMLVSLGVATFTLGLGQQMKMSRIMDAYGDAVKDVAMILMITSGAGALKQILIESGVSSEIAGMLGALDIHPLVLGWGIASVIRVCVGSATVAGLTAAGVLAPLMGTLHVDPNLMVISVGAGSLMFSHVNDTGFWLFKEYFNLSIRETIRSWSLMETIVSVCGLIGVMILQAIL
ncbi:gluconate:H+ symporter [Dawidia soli]|uniref:Gluconate:H+ symporter n=1 Tax=Dawidia soli TaxID=2782352 RepID=A0AAP2DA45_9BACT|nr:gluconate:H+ symporter [Dawidia soli]MBT1687281.1 gluconate:H+ symporter [Dawidia soli]